MIAKLLSAYRSFVALLNHLQSPLLLAIRLFWGWEFGSDGWSKLHNLDRVTNYFTTLNLPAPHLTALSVGLIEFVGGVLLATGIFTRLTALVLFVNMSAAFWTAERDAFLGFFTNPDKFAAADAYSYWFVALLILILGPGAFALDTLFQRWLPKTSN
jgi:putative oxidoreductase